jgi:hypothetical protein
MEIQTEPIVIKDDIMIQIRLLDGSFEVNEELISVILQTAAYFGLSSVEDLRKVTEQDFFTVFTPMMNDHYGLK